MLDKLQSSNFLPYLNQKFRVYLESDEALEAELIDVSELGSEATHEEGRRRPFSVVFRVVSDLVLSQKIYTIEHDELGTLDLFLVPIGPDKEGIRYEAVFN